jgi:uncharacterized membrane protein YeaQ/YmgE (transglycosylase-associated protein family)
MKKFLENVDWEMVFKFTMLMSFVIGFYSLLNQNPINEEGNVMNFIYGFSGGFLGSFIFLFFIRLTLLLKIYLNEKFGWEL